LKSSFGRGQKNIFYTLEKCYNYFSPPPIEEIDNTLILLRCVPKSFSEYYFQYMEYTENSIAVQWARLVNCQNR
jgi:hypothetical protein